MASFDLKTHIHPLEQSPISHRHHHLADDVVLDPSPSWTSLSNAAITNGSTDCMDKSGIHFASSSVRLNAVQTPTTTRTDSTRQQQFSASPTFNHHELRECQPPLAYPGQEDFRFSHAYQDSPGHTFGAKIQSASDVTDARARNQPGQGSVSVDDCKHFALRYDAILFQPIF